MEDPWMSIETAAKHMDYSKSRAIALLAQRRPMLTSSVSGIECSYSEKPLP